MNVQAAVTGWSAVSGFGIGAESFSAGVNSGRSAVASVPESLWATSRAAVVPDFEIRRVLGKHGTRSMDRLGALAAATVRDIVSPGTTTAVETDDPYTALILGTTGGSTKSMADITRDTLTQAKPFFIDTGAIPNAIMNSAAAVCAIRHGLRGPNVTVAGGTVAALLAVRYATRLLTSKRARIVLCGGAEELTPDRVRLEQAIEFDDHPLGEGCALIRLEPAETAGPVLAHVLAVEIAVHATASDIPRAFADCFERTLARSGTDVDDVSTVSAVCPSRWRDSQQRAFDRIFVGRNAHPTIIDPCSMWGNAGAAGGAFQFTELITRGEPGTIHAVTAIDRDGSLGCAMVRIR